MNTFELNNIRKDSVSFNGKFGKTSPIVEIFAAMVNGESLERFGAKANKAVEEITSLANRCEMGDTTAIAELNTLRRFVIEAPVMEELKLLGIFGSYKPVGFDETIEREVWREVGERSREQAANGDVVFPAIVKETYPVSTFTVSGGYAVDYRRVALGDMTKEHEGMQHVKTDILNRAKMAIVKRVYEAIKNANGVKYHFEGAGLTKAGVDGVLNNVRRNGRPTIIGDYAVISQLTPWAGYVGNVNGNTITGISEKAMNELAQMGTLSMYNGAIVTEMPNPYDFYNLNEAGDNFKTLMPAGLAFVIPAGVQSPIATYSRGGLTSFTGNDVKSGKIMTRFDLEIGCDVAKGMEHKIGMLYDSAIGGLE